jgi:transcriptional regulator with XRE-family HTH domain
MNETRAHSSSQSGIGPLLQYWRRSRHLSQLALANEAQVSPRHLCFIETGRAKPSREMVLLLADALQVPLRERNGLLLAAGFAPIYKETSLDAPELAAVRGALDAIMQQQEPFPAVIMNRRWDILGTNGAATRFFGYLTGAATSGPGNVVRMMFDPAGLRPLVSNWDAVAQALIRRIHREAVGGAADDVMRGLLDEVFAYPGVPAHWRAPDLATPLVPVVPIAFRKDHRTFNFFSTVTTLGTPQDITLQEIRIECFFPADADTGRYAREL